MPSYVAWYGMARGEPKVAIPEHLCISTVYRKQNWLGDFDCEKMAQLMSYALRRSFTATAIRNSGHGPSAGEHSKWLAEKWHFVGLKSGPEEIM